MRDSAAVEALLFAALEKPAAERNAFLDSACAGDAGLRRQLDRLLQAHRHVGDFLQQPAVERLAATPGPAGDTRAADAATDGPDAMPTVQVRPFLPRAEGGGAGDEGVPLDFLEPPARAGSLGRLGHYEALEVLGRGGFGIVFRAFDDQLQRVVAIKALAPEMAATSPPRKRFLREARSSARVRHENVVQVYAVEEEPLPYLVMEFVPGESLQQRIDRAGPLETPEVLEFGRQLAEGLAAAHARGLVHRDIKPANVLLEAGPNPHVKITDFGLARAADDASLTQSGVVTGTPMYMAPEQARGEALDHRADLFSLGSVLYIMASGRPPFRAPSTLAVLRRVAEDTPRPIREIIPEVPAWLCELIAKLHSKKPEDRLATAKEVADQLGRGLAALQQSASAQPPPVAAPPAVPQTPSQETPAAAPTLERRWGPHRWPVAAAVLLVLLGGLGVTEATGVTNARGTVIRLFSPSGTLEVQVDDPGVSVQIDGEDLVITGAGAREIRLKPGSYTVEARRDGQVVKRELVTVTKNGRQVVRVSQVALATTDKGWTILKPSAMTSAGGTTLTLQADGSILASGDLPPQDSYTLTFRGLPARIQALRLEVLPHDTLPQQGPGRHPSQNFSLTTFKAELRSSGNPGLPRGLTLARARADQWRGQDSHVGYAIDADDNTGWVTAVGKPHFAVFEVAEPVATSESTELCVTLEFKHRGPRLLLGCFRLSVGQETGGGVIQPAASLDPDRRAAEYVLSIGGTVKVNGQNQEIRAAADLPRESFRLCFVKVQGSGQVTDADLAVFKGCQNLTQLMLQGLPVTDLGLAHLQDCRNLTEVWLDQTRVTDAGLAFFKDNPHLTGLSLCSTRLTDAGLAHLKGCKNLTGLSLQQTQITDVGLADLAGLDKLTLLGLQKTKVTARGVEGLAKALPKCGIGWDGGTIKPK